MKDIHRQFLLDSIKKLKNLQINLQKAESFSDPERREVFRTLHTIKGTAQTFGFASSSRLAHELESLLSAGQIITNKIFQSLFTEGIKFLISSFEQKDFEFPAQFAEKIHRAIPANLQSPMTLDISLPEIPGEIFECLSQTEKTALDAALKNGKNFYCFEVGFDAADFTVKLKECREVLSAAGEIIATFPGAKFNSSGQIGFRILFASSVKKAQIEEIAEVYAAKITLDISPDNFTNDLQGILSKVAAHGKDLANKLGKKIDFTVSADEINLSAENLKLVFDILLHLLRNAVDHAVEKKGEIKIDVKAKENGLHLIVADNGSGIDLEKVKVKAIEKKLIAADNMLTEQATLNLIFQSEFSTAPEITEISGRGIGLDVVKDAVEKSGGTINVQSQNGKGTTFEIFLPN